MNKSPVEQERLEDRFVQKLEELVRREDRATLAKLRRGLGKEFGLAPERDGWVLAHLPSNLSDRKLEAFCLVASLFAVHPVGGQGSLGAAFARLQAARSGEGTERRFTALLDSDAEDLAPRLRQAITLLKANDIAPDWADLLLHVQHWDDIDRRVQKQWARNFWGGRKNGPTEGQATQETTI